MTMSSDGRTTYRPMPKLRTSPLRRMPTPFRPHTTVFLVVLPACFVAALTVSLGCRQAKTPDVPQQASPAVKATPRSAEDVVRLIQRKNQAIAELESEKFEASIVLFEELAEELPAEPLVATDLVVAYILLLKSPAMGAQSGSLVYQQTAEKAEQAVLRLLRIAGDSATSHVLASKVARLRSDERRSLEELNRAVELAPADPIVWYELFQAGRHSEDAQIKARAREGLKRAYELWPDNLCVLRERLLQQASDRDSTIAETLAKARATIEPLVDSSQTWRRVNLLNMIDQAVAAVADHSLDGEAKWNTVLQRVRPSRMCLAPSMRPELIVVGLIAKTKRIWPSWPSSCMTSAPRSSPPSRRCPRERPRRSR